VGQNCRRWSDEEKGRKSKIRARVEHVFAEQKHRMGLFVRTIGIARATTKIGMANLVYNIKRLIFLARSPSHDQLELRKPTHSTHYPIAIRLN
jgi:hypothetical protein